tara:strand:+ start:40 stop:501 length:462 start_codon:yes stop_codon:yes gene_type:complete
MKFSISKQHIEKRRKSPIFLAVYIIAISLTFYTLGEWTISYLLISTFLILALTVIPNWLESRRYIAEAKVHYIEVNDSSILSFGEGYKSETDLNAVSEIILNKNRSGLKSILLKSGRSVLARLENYEGINKIASLIIKSTPNAKIIEKRWIHS